MAITMYSKKVDYLYGDYDALLTDIRTAFAHIENLNLPENASAAPFESVTMPLRTSELDAVDLDDSINFERTSDNHLKTPADITLEDQVPVSQDPYLDFFINEDIDMDRDTSPQELIPDSSNSQVEEDVPETCIPQEIPEIEVVRDADPNLSLAEKSSEHLSISREQSESVQHNPDPPTAFAPVESFGNGRVSDIAFGNESFQIAIYPTPQDEKEKPKTRKRKQFFDMHIVLDNDICKGNIKDTSMLVCQRRKLPCSSLDVWRLGNRLRKDQLFYQSSITGLSKCLLNLFERDYVSSRSQIIGPGDVQENAGANARTSVPDFDMEIDNEQPNVDKEVLPDVGTEVEHIPPVVEAETEHLRPDDNPEIEYGRFEDGSADRDFTTEFMATPTPFKTSRFEHQTGSSFETEVPIYPH
ncbi:sister chromatid cohesion 1 protein 3-like [Papaver somniferum]|uniref:sister chromatid cohesion 1 protein 3-like n=1 Tax=Papaver somniferum TaxID=3469 RepID=UPI000E6F7E0C|nr:sister chromatid cohesion 1 protein 3-like [Papaver somniferum]